jgi:hypothetical protein
MDKCPGVIGGINDPSTSCNIQSSVNEQIDGILTALPGNNPVTGWGTSGGSAPLSGSSSSSSSSAASPASSGSPGGSVYGGGYGSSSSSAAAPASSGSPSPVYGDNSPSSSPSPAMGSSTPAGLSAPASSALGAGYGSGPAGSACAVVTVTTTMTAWYTPGSSAAPSSTSSSTAGGPTNPTIPNWTYTGCYTDVSNARVLSGITFANLGTHNTTTTGCVAYCDAQGYSIAGTEYGGQCFCGNSLASASTKVGDDKCSMACEGDRAQLCGGSLTLSVYSKGTSAWKGKRGGTGMTGRRVGRRGLY